jgi:hypothetical protein
MNAHINHDLPVAVVSTCAQLATSPAAGTHLADYQKVDQLLDAAEQSVRQSFESAPELRRSPPAGGRQPRRQLDHQFGPRPRLEQLPAAVGIARYPAPRATCS